MLSVGDTEKESIFYFMVEKMCRLTLIYVSYLI